MEFPVLHALSREDWIAFGAMDPAGNLIPGYGDTPEEGAATQVWAATSPQLIERGGLYLENVDVAQLLDPRTQRGGVQPYAIDPAEAERLWSWSAGLTGVNAFA